MPKIYISPSTQHANIGFGGYGSEEKQMNLVADVVCKCLTESGIEWKRNEPDMTLVEVANDSNRYKPDFHFAIHSNAGGGRGTEALIYSLSRESERFANIIYSKISALTPTKDRGIKVMPELYELKYTKAKACIIEIAFHDNKGDAEFIMKNIQEIGIALAQGICEYFGVELKNPYEINYKALYEESERKLDQIRKIGGWDNGR
ncbi:MAG: N-acetylmuramoyl-L-alanine amidase [Eubacteriales bacterium]|nr:N-acetylmuramoyl-L-alanine amidase [Eubacteriales bacterium]